MKLVIKGNPHLSNCGKLAQKVVVTYDPVKQLTIVDCDIDIVTLGIAVYALTEQFENCLTQLHDGLAKDIRETTRKAVGTYEKY